MGRRLNQSLPLLQRREKSSGCFFLVELSLGEVQLDSHANAEDLFAELRGEGVKSID
jgi:hypothetical protein